MFNSELKKRLAEDMITEPTETEVVTSLEVDTHDPITQYVDNVMIAYQNANRYLDIIKEYLLMECGSVFFSNYIHQLAHKMPGEFDKFGDILHTGNIKVPYPPTEAIPYEMTTMESCFSAIFSILDNIRASLREFIKFTEGSGMSCSTEDLLMNIDGEFTNLYRMQKAYSVCGDLLKFDSWVSRYIDHAGDLID